MWIKVARAPKAQIDRDASLRGLRRLQVDRLALVFRTAAVAWLLVATSLAAAQAPEEAWSLGGDLRVAAVASERVDGSGVRTDAQALRSRLRLALSGQPSDTLRVGLRIAGRHGSDQDGSDAYLGWSAPGRAGSALGDTTLDEAWLQWSPAGRPWSLRLGRFQHAASLATLTGKSIGQNDSPHLGVNWTDGIRLQRESVVGGTLTLLLRYMDPDGPGSVHRAPLDFAPGGSRVAGFVGWESRQALGPLVQRSFGLDLLPRALPDGMGARGYTQLSSRAVGAWPMGEGGARWLLGGELSYATPSSSGDGRLAWQLEADIEGAQKKHMAGVVLGRVPAGFLLSSDFRDNDRLAEFRYRWRVHKQLDIAARWRWRGQVTPPAGVQRQRIDRDAYVNATWRF